MPKRGENIHKRKDGRWEGRILISSVGDKKYQSIYGKSYTDVKQKMRTFKFEWKEPETKVKFFNEVCQSWLQSIKVRNKESTIAKYKHTIDKHILPYFKEVRTSELNQDKLNQFMQEKMKTGRLDRKGALSSKTIHDITTILLQIIHYAIKAGYIRNFNCEIEKPVIQKKEIDVLSINEQNKLVTLVKEDIKRDIKCIGILLSLYTGMRLGEICALKWSDVQLDIGVINITKTIQRIKNIDINSNSKTKIIIDIPKTRNSVRQVPIPSFLLVQLKEWSKKFSSDAYILTGNSSKYIEPRTYQNIFKKYLKQASVRNINFHALRHTFATRSIEQDVDVKSLSDILGHATVSFTLERYVHPSFDLKRLNMEKLSVYY